MTAPALPRYLTPWIAVGIFFLAVLVYGFTLPPTLSFWDCGEYITTAHILGIPHQPGTPLYVLVGRVFDLLLGWLVSTAVAVNFMSAFFSALAVSFVFLTVVKIGRMADPDSGWLPQAGGLVGALFLLFSDTFWNNAIEAEVYGLAGFMIAFLTWLALKWYESRRQPNSNRLLYLLYYLLGLGVGFHLGTLLVYPGIFLMVVLARDRRLEMIDLLGMSFGLALFLMSTMNFPTAVMTVGAIVLVALIVIRSAQGKHFVLVGSLLFMLGLSVHLFMLIRAGLDPAINQSQPDNFATLMSVLRREQYPPINLLPRKADFLWQIGYYYNYLVDQFTFLDVGNLQITRFTTFIGPIFLALLGLIHGIWRARAWIWMVLVNYLVNADILNIYLNFSDHEVRERDYFFFAGFLFFTILIGVGAGALLRYAAGPLGSRFNTTGAREKIAAIRIPAATRIIAAVLVILAMLPMLQPGHAKWFSHDRTENRTAHEYAWNLLAGLDRNAILFTNGDNDTFPVWYLQEVEGFRRDVNIVNLSLVNLAWYTKQIKRADPPLPLSYTENEIEKLRWTVYEDPKTGQREMVMVKDYIVNDVLRTAFGKRPIFFAVTIPQSNIARYFPMLQMEGLAYRFIGQESEDGMPSVDSERLLANCYGVYRYDATLDGDSQWRRDEFCSRNGVSDRIQSGNPDELIGDREWDFHGLFERLGVYRADIIYDENANHLSGNYPAGLIRAAYDYLTRAESVPQDDDALYLDYLSKAEAALTLAHAFDPLFPMVTDILPMVQVEMGRAPTALANMDEIHGLVPPQDEQKTIMQLVNALLAVEEDDLALQWLEKRIENDERNPLYYQMIFRIHNTRNNVQGCREVQAMWESRFGQPDKTMADAIRRMETGGEG